MSILTKLLDPNEREVKRHHAVAEAINALEPELKALDDAGLRARSDALREQAREDHDLDELLIEAFALCREAGRRSIGLRHFDVWAHHPYYGRPTETPTTKPKDRTSVTLANIGDLTKLLTKLYGNNSVPGLYELNIPARTGTNGFQDGYDVIGHIASLPFTQEFISVNLERADLQRDRPGSSCGAAAVRRL